jgi:hypothetical protein
MEPTSTSRQEALQGRRPPFVRIALHLVPLQTARCGDHFPTKCFREREALGAYKLGQAPHIVASSTLSRTKAIQTSRSRVLCSGGPNLGKPSCPLSIISGEHFREVERQSRVEERALPRVQTSSGSAEPEIRHYCLPEHPR